MQLKSEIRGPTNRLRRWSFNLRFTKYFSLHMNSFPLTGPYSSEEGKREVGGQIIGSPRVYLNLGTASCSIMQPCGRPRGCDISFVWRSVKFCCKLSISPVIVVVICAVITAFCSRFIPAEHFDMPVVVTSIRYPNVKSFCYSDLLQACIRKAVGLLPKVLHQAQMGSRLYVLEPVDAAVWLHDAKFRTMAARSTKSCQPHPTLMISTVLQSNETKIKQNA